MANTIAKQINFNGLYKCEASDKYKKGDLHWCTNWTFHPRQLKDGRVIMIDTYWSSYSDGLSIEVTEENISDFEFVFDYDQVEQIKEDRVYQYDNVIRIANDSGGWGFAKNYVNKSDERSFDKVINKIDDDIEKFERRIRNLKGDKERVMTEGKVPSWWY